MVRPGPLLLLALAFLSGSHGHADAVGGLGLRSALAGAIAGGVTNTILHPLDTCKTLRQRHPQQYKSTLAALSSTLRTRGIGALYRGVIPAAIGAMPSSALYFGFYDIVKRRLTRFVANRDQQVNSRGGGGGGGGQGGSPLESGIRPVVHMTAAVCGNAASSLVFVPKEFVKQQLQTNTKYRGLGGAFQVVAHTVKTKGVGAVYAGYTATLLRNIPSAAIRFVIYEEAKILLESRLGSVGPREFFLAGAVSGLVASSCTTPMDVMKTKFATGALDRSRGLLTCVAEVVRREGAVGLLTGLQGRILWSTLFSSIGFAAFESAKSVLGVPSSSQAT
uniref:Mitochondrial carrier protein n=1 Tax=Rhizochromulina marina TaxID=1034831 RepID=A0A7S2STS4_9STRA|mmetsp:Transcript_76/g.252  ORF Transcript_76/g.252 Transcript_76/m.252 type:complete len:334 (+) Transcript_76:129-1130(+)